MEERENTVELRYSTIPLDELYRQLYGDLKRVYIHLGKFLKSPQNIKITIEFCSFSEVEDDPSWRND